MEDFEVGDIPGYKNFTSWFELTSVQLFRSALSKVEIAVLTVNIWTDKAHLDDIILKTWRIFFSKFDNIKISILLIFVLE